MANGSLIRAGTVEVIQEFGAAPATAPRPVLSSVAIGESFQIEEQEFAGFYAGTELVAGELVGTGDGVNTNFQLANTPVDTGTVALFVGSPTGTPLTVTTDFSVTTGGAITLTPTGVAALGTDDLFADYTFIPDQTFAYPNIKQGAEIVDLSKVSVFLRTAEDIFDITNGFGVIITDNSVTVPGGLIPTRELTALNGQVTLAASTDTIIDTTLDYFALGVRPSDALNFVTDSANLDFPDSIVSGDASTRSIISVVNSFTLTIDPVAGPTSGKVEYVISRTGSGNGDILISYTARRKDQVGRLLAFDSVEGVEEQLGPIVPENPLAYALSLMLANTANQVFGVMVGEDSVVEHQKALDFLEGEDVYLLVPLTFNSAIQTIYQAHADQLSEPLSAKERRVIFTHFSTERTVFQQLSTTGQISKNSQSFTDPNALFLGNGVAVGSVVRLQTPASLQIDNVDRDEVIITGVTSNTQLTLIGQLTQGTLISGESVGIGDALETVFQLANTSNVIPSEVTIFFDGVAQPDTSFTATAAGAVTFTVAPGSGVVITADYELDIITGINYTVETQLLTNAEIARIAADSGRTFSDRRVTLTFGNQAEADDGTLIDGFFINAIFAGLVSGVEANRPLANTPLGGIRRVVHLRDFSDNDFGVMAAGGVMPYIQDRPTSPVVSRNSITTDLTNVNTREMSIVHAVDFYAKSLRNNVGPLAGRFNITDEFIDNMLVPAINGNNRDLINAQLIGPGTVIVSVEKGQDVGGAKDQLFVIIDAEFFAPANRITITVRVL